MEKKLTMEMLLELPSKIIKTSESPNNTFLNLLGESICEKYYYRDLKKDLKKFFDHFNDMKYSLDIAIEEKIKYTSSYSYNESKKVQNSSDVISNLIEKEIDNEIFIHDVYNRIINLSSKFTYNEAIYFVDAFFSKKTDEHISEILGISRNTLQKIRKSCLVKTLLSLPIDKYSL